MIAKVDDRYWFQPFRVRLWRWIRHMPLAYTGAVLVVVLWLCRGAKPVPPFGRRWTLRMIFAVRRGRAQIDMGAWYTHEEIMGEIGE